MIGSSRRDAVIQELQADGLATRAQFAALSTQIAALASRMETGFEQQVAMVNRWAKLEERVDRLEAAFGTRLDAQAGAVRAQAAAVAALDEAGVRQAEATAALEMADERHAEAVRQLRADIARIGLQAACDLDEMRAADAAIAELVFSRASGRAGSSAPVPESSSPADPAF